MFIDGDFRTIYLNCKEEIVPFLKSLPKVKKETIVLFKKYVNKERNQNVISLPASQVGNKNGNGYGFEAASVYFVDGFLSENFCFLNSLFNSYQDVYYRDSSGSISVALFFRLRFCNKIFQI